MQEGHVIYKGYWRCLTLLPQPEKFLKINSLTDKSLREEEKKTHDYRNNCNALEQTLFLTIPRLWP